MSNTSSAVLLATLLLAAACGGLGSSELSAVDVVLAAPTTLHYAGDPSHRHGLWMTYDLAFTGGDYRITGSVVATVADKQIATWEIDLAHDRGPVVGQPRTATQSSEVSYDGQGSASATVWLGDLPPQSKDTPVTVTATLINGPATTVKLLRLVVRQ